MEAALAWYRARGAIRGPLGPIRVPLVPYLVVSTLVMAGYIVALVCGGEAVAQGNAPLALAAAGLLVASVVALQLLRQRAVRKRAAAAIIVVPSHPVSAE